MTASKAIAMRILEIAKEQKITINKLCTNSGVTQSTINHILQGTSKNPMINTILKICAGSGMELPEFFNSKLFRNLDIDD